MQKLFLINKYKMDDTTLYYNIRIEVRYWLHYPKIIIIIITTLINVNINNISMIIISIICVHR